MNVGIWGKSDMGLVLFLRKCPPHWQKLLFKQDVLNPVFSYAKTAIDAGICGGSR
jgi:hypothetical protein